MTLLTLPLRSARAKWLRTLLLTLVFSLGVASMAGLRQVSDCIGESFEKKLVSYGANILITPKREILSVRYGDITLGDVNLEDRVIPLSAAKAAIDAMPLRGNVAIVAPKALAVARLDDKPVILVGVDWKEELALKGFWEADGELPSQRVGSTPPHEALVGQGLAQTLGVQPGQEVTVQGKDGVGQRLRISGILKPTGGDDDAVLFAPLSVVQSINGKPDAAAFLEVAALCAGCPIEDIVGQLQTALPETEVRALRQVAETRMMAVHFAQNLAFSVSLVILVTACAMIVMSMLSAVNERRKEIGIMRAVGFSRVSVFSVFAVEAVGIGAAAGGIGYAVGHALAGEVLSRLHLEDVAARGFDLGALVLAMVLVAAVAGLASVFPAWKATLVEPAEALTSL